MTSHLIFTTMSRDMKSIKLALINLLICMHVTYNRTKNDPNGTQKQQNIIFRPISLKVDA